MEYMNTMRLLLEWTLEQVSGPDVQNIENGMFWLFLQRMLSFNDFN